MHTAAASFFRSDVENRTLRFESRIILLSLYISIIAMVNHFFDLFYSVRRALHGGSVLAAQDLLSEQHNGQTSWLIRDKIDLSTLLHQAASRGDLALVQFLVGQGCDLEARDIHGKSILHDAVCRGGSVFVVDFLLTLKGVDLGGQDFHGYTPFLRAVLLHNRAMVTMLFQKGANPRACTERGHNLLQLCPCMTYDMILHLLSLLDIPTVHWALSSQTVQPSYRNQVKILLYEYKTAIHSVTSMLESLWERAGGELTEHVLSYLVATDIRFSSTETQSLSS